MLSLFLCLQHRRFWLKRLDFFRCLELLYNHQTNAPRTIFVRGVFFMTTQQTTYRFGALGNSGDKSAEERGFPSGKGRKKLFLAEIAFIGPFGTKMPQVRILSPRPNERTLQIAESFFVKTRRFFKPAGFA